MIQHLEAKHHKNYKNHKSDKDQFPRSFVKACEFCVQGSTEVLLKSPLLKFFSVFGGLLWTIVYIDAIYLGWRDSSFAIPTFAMAMNISWEFIMSFIYPHHKAFIRNRNILWFLFDVVLVYQNYINGSLHEFTSVPLIQDNFHIILPVTLAAVFLGLYLFINVAHDQSFGIITATIISVIMSALFIAMFFARGGNRGQSLIIAICKHFGTELMFINQYYMGYNHPFYLYMYAMVALLDWTYIYCLVAL